MKKVFLEISQNSQENTCVRASYSIKLQASGLRHATLLKNRLCHRCFPVNFVKFLRTPFYGTPLVAASVQTNLSKRVQKNLLKAQNFTKMNFTADALTITCRNLSEKIFLRALPDRYF